jgi:sugar/nucleoside kinase (ribokinase family)
MIKKDVIAIGSATLDAFFETNFEVIKWPQTPLRKAMAIPLGEKFGSKSVYFTSGGNASNASVTFARQGLKTSIFTKIGKDVAGREILRIWRKECVNTKLVTFSKLPTSYSVLLLQNGERSIISHHGAINEFNLLDIKMKALRSRWWYVSLPGDSYKAFGKLLEYAKQNNIKIALNPGYKHLVGDGLKQLLIHLKDIHFLVVNSGEAALITGIPFSKEKEVFGKLDELVPGVVAVTSGSGGVSVSDGKFIYKAGIFANKKVLDRTGAGDAFGSGFVAGLVRRKEKFKNGVCKPENIEYAIRLASANATSVVEHLGATEGILTKEQLDTTPRFKKLNIIKSLF